MLKGNMLIAHGGGPTPVINSSLLGAVREAKRHPEIETIYGARFGAEGILAGDLMDLGACAGRAAGPARPHPRLRPGLLPPEAHRRGLSRGARVLQEVQHPLLLLQRRQRLHGHLPQGLPAGRARPAMSCASSASPRPSTTTWPSPTTAPASAARPSTPPPARWSWRRTPPPCPSTSWSWR